MGRTVMTMLAVAIVAMDLITESSGATTHIVGDSMGWTIPQSGATAYSDWAANQTFAVGDILVFNYPTGIHDVAEVTKANYDACDSTSPISLATTGPTNISLTTSGSHYFFCTFGTHCSQGQKLAVNVPTTSTTPSPSPSPSPSTPTPSSPSPAPSTPTAPSPGTSQVPVPAPAPATAIPPSSITPSPSPSTSTSPSPSPTSPAGTPSSPSTPPMAGETPGSPPSPPPPPPPPSFAPSVAAATGVTFLAIALALVY